VPLLTRRALLASGAAWLASGCALRGERRAPAAIPSERARPVLPYGVQCGDVAPGRAVVWSRSDRPARLHVEWGTAEDLRGATRIEGPWALAESDFTARVDLADLPAGADVFYRATFVADDGAASEPVAGRLRTPPAEKRTIRFCFSGDEAGQGWGIDRARGGMKLYETMRRAEPDFFLHLGDQIYADGPLAEEVALADGTRWRNLVTPAKAKIAESLAEFRGNFAYNLLDESKRRFASEVPFFVQWDDHEVRNNWYPGQPVPAVAPGASIDASLLAARARRAMHEYCPIRTGADAPLFRSFSHGPALDVFLLDARSHRAANGPGAEPQAGAATAFYGEEQLAWLERGLRDSRATWKVVASEMPLSIVVRDLNPYAPKGWCEALANGRGGPPLGRELELARILSFVRRNGIRNLVWLGADVHYACAIHYDPRRAAFRDFAPFWEFIAGPLHAGTFALGELDPSFGPEIRFASVPRDLAPNRPPSEGLQFFGLAEIDGASEDLTVSLRNLAGERIFEVRLGPER
jgi:alkaline phosphatase D